MQLPDTSTSASTYDVVVIGASAGGLPAMCQLISGLGKDFALPVVLMLHLPPGAEPEGMLQRMGMRVERLRGGQPIGTSVLWCCPPRSFVELFPDGTVAVTDNPQGAVARPIDRLLESTARSFGPRAIGVILSGMGNDGAAGANALRAAGGRILAQSPGSCEYPDMPTAAIQAGATDLVVPLTELGDVLAELAQGAPQTRTRAELRAIDAVFGHRGEVALAARECDWQATPLGPVLTWAEPLRTLVREGVDSPHAVALWWGRELLEIYNEGWSIFLGARHPAALGQPARTNWGSGWERVESSIDQVQSQGQSVGNLGLSMLVQRGGKEEEVFADLSLAPLRDASGALVGIRCMLWETTFDVVAQRRMRLLHELATRLAQASTRNDGYVAVTTAFEADPATVPFGLIYLVDPRGLQATLACAAGLVAGSSAAPHLIHVAATNTTGWPLARVIGQAGAPASVPTLIDLADGRLQEFAGVLMDTTGSSRAEQVLLAPLRARSTDAAHGILILGLARHRPYDGAYARFVETLVQQIATGLGNARAKELERERSDRLATLDRAKTEFFANVSHEFRTPLTLLLAPLEALTRERGALPPQIDAELDAALRSARRLLRMVNSLLDFSQIDVRGRKATVVQTDLGLLTMDIASAFRSAIEAARLDLHVDIAPGLPAVPVNSGMWEQIVSNLLANAFKFTFEGTITVRLKALRLHAELEVSDTGIGIPAGELQSIFQRFHRVRGARARTAEGAGIGLSLVQDLVSRMGGQLTVRSVEGRGSTFTVWLPLVAQPMRTEVIEGKWQPEPQKLAIDLASEAAGWTSNPDTIYADVVDDLLEPPAAATPAGARGRILIVDDNADMRQYLQRLLAGRWDVQLAVDGAHALELARARTPDLVLTDVMMPNLDGFALLRAIREDESLKNTPVIFLTARAGEDTAIEGLLAGADDYLAKPFSARELVARVGGQIELARARRRTEELNAFLVRFSDSVRGVHDPRAVAQTACRMVADKLQVERAYWTEIDWQTREFVIGVSFERSGATPVSGRFALDAWEPFTTSLLEGRPVVVDDTRVDARLTPQIREGYAQFQVGADIAMPVMVNGQCARLISVNQRAPRRWTDDETALLRGIAVRCWAEVERARAEAALRESEAQLAAELEDARLLQKLSMQLVSKDGSDAHYNRIVEVARTLMRSEAASIQQLDAANARLKLIAHSGFHPESAAFWTYVNADVGSSCGRALSAGERVVVPDMDAFEADAHDLAAYRKSGIMSVQSTPLVASSGRIVGMMSTHWKRPHAPGAESYRYFDILSRLTADFMERALTEAALRASEEKFRTLFETLDEGYCLLELVLDEGDNVVDWIYLELNESFARQTGDAGRAALGKRGTEWLPNYDREWLGMLTQVYKTGEPLRTEIHPKDLDRWVSAHYSRVGGPGSPFIATIFNDISDRKRAEMALRESAQRQAFLLKFSDALRAEPDADAVAYRAIRMLADEMQLDRCYITFYRPADDEADVPYQVGNNTVPPLPPKVRLSDFPEAYAQVLEKTFIVEDDFERRGLSPEERANSSALGMRAMVASTARKGERNPVCSLAAVSSRPRRWTQGEIALVEEAAERTWGAMERVRAELARIFRERGAAAVAQAARGR